MSYFKKNTFVDVGLSINPNYDEEIKQGDVVFLTSSVFNFNNCFGVFDTEAERRYTATVFITEADNSGYRHGSHQTGGDYAFAVGKVVDIRDFE